MVLTCEQMKQAEEAAFARGVNAADLMETAGLGIANIVRQYFWRPGTCVLFLGKGNNAGDALVAARHLQKIGWRIAIHAAFGAEAFSELPAKHFAAVKSEPLAAIPPERPLVVLDGLLGIGAAGEPRGPVADAIETLNRLRREHAAWVLAIDIPSGLDGDTGLPAASCVQADFTATIAAVKQGLLADSAINAVGRLAVVPLPVLEFSAASGDSVATPDVLRQWLPPRPFDMHKGKCGCVGILAGSPGFLGAARMCSAAVVRAGGGLVTIFAKSEIASALSTAYIPEVMVKTITNYRDVLHENLDVLAIGPGLGFDHATEVLSVIRDAPQPAVIDADALTMLAKDMGLLRRCAGPRLLTPHPGEMERLFSAGGRPRRQWAQDFLEKYPVTLLLKGARTLTGANGQFFYNTTGNPGMASGGMGDVLTGTCAALIPQIAGEKKLLRSAVLGAWLCGRAGELGAFEPDGSPESLSATTVLARLGGAFRALREEV